MKQSLEAAQPTTVIVATEPAQAPRKTTHPSILRKQRIRTLARSRMRLRR